MSGIEWDAGADFAAYQEYEQRDRDDAGVHRVYRRDDPLEGARRAPTAHLALLWLIAHQPESEGP